MRATVTAGRAAQPVAFADSYLADPDPDADHPNRDAHQPNGDTHQPNGDTHDSDGDARHNHDERGTSHNDDHDERGDDDGKRQRECFRPGDGVSQGDRGPDPHAEIESRRHRAEDGDEDATGEDD
ncbi:MAG: hypothetical protein ACRDP7_22475, partial [Trebonia sp.]